MRAYILTDLEGVACVQSWQQTREAGPLYEQAKRLLSAEVGAAVDGILDVEPSAEIVVWDGHGSGGLDLEALHPSISLIPRGPIAAPYYLDEGVDALYFVGQHAMAGTPAAPLSHTYSSRTIEYYKLNGIAMGEFGCRAALAGSLGIPTLFISGDDKAVAEARALVPQIYGAAVKQGRGIESAIHLSPQRARQLIRTVAAEATRHVGDIDPYVLEPPYTLEIRVLRNVDVTPYLQRPGAERIDDRTILLRSDNLIDLRL
ncbi:MAG: M55 family metallopeptidase [Anaerolineae bacterium]|nr:M55 family metallopeptidase [Anaerolineae bacterium]